MNAGETRDHGGGLDAAIAKYGGEKNDWIDLSTGINPVPYPIGEISASNWNSLPDQTATLRLEDAARKFWRVPDDAAVLAAPGASALIARIPGLMGAGTVAIAGPTYNEHAAAFSAHNWAPATGDCDARVVVHPNNPDGRLYDHLEPAKKLTIIDESFCDVAPDRSHINLASRSGVLILKSFGKFWGLAGLRLGFAIGDPTMINDLAGALGPWPVSGPALAIGTAALSDPNWAAQTRQQLVQTADRLDTTMTRHGARSVGGTSLFRLYEVDNAARWQTRLARSRIWSRIFPYSDNWLRLGMPAPDAWPQLSDAL